MPLYDYPLWMSNQAFTSHIHLQTQDWLSYRSKLLKNINVLKYFRITFGVNNSQQNAWSYQSQNYLLLVGTGIDELLGCLVLVVT